MKKPKYIVAIFNALRNGYRVDADRGIIYGLKGSPLTIALRGIQRYPTVTIVVKGMGQRFYVVPAHKLMACAIWGDDAWLNGVHVRHGKGGVLDISQANLTIGSASENNLDKCPKVRSAAARKARLSQGSEPKNIILTSDKVAEIMKEVQYGKNGRVRRGECTRFASRYGVKKSAISMAIKDGERRAKQPTTSR